EYFLGQGSTVALPPGVGGDNKFELGGGVHRGSNGFDPGEGARAGREVDEGLVGERCLPIFGGRNAHKLRKPGWCDCHGRSAPSWVEPAWSISARARAVSSPLKR